MTNKINLKPFSEKNYTELIAEVGRYRYGIFSPDKELPGNIFSKNNGFDEYQHVIACTGATTANYVISEIKGKDIIIPKDSLVFVGRFLRRDATHGPEHFNANDQIIFHSKEGNTYSFARNNAPDHYVALSASAGITNIAQAYKLPLERTGSIEQYQAAGASIHINLELVTWDGQKFVTVNTTT